MNPSEKWESSQDLSVAAFHAVRDLLLDKDANAIRGYIYEANEWGLGVEAIIDTLVECNVEISQFQKRALDAAADSMGLDRDQAKLVVSDP
jgi:hypothetical protein